MMRTRGAEAGFLGIVEGKLAQFGIGGEILLLSRGFFGLSNRFLRRSLKATKRVIE